MSLVRIAVRHCLVEALRGRTLVGDNVRDSQIGAFDVAADGSLKTSESGQFLTVYTDAAKATMDAIDLRQMTANGTVDILFETGVTDPMLETNPETGEKMLTGVAIPATDDAFEFNLDLVVRQIGTALTDPANDWAQLFNGFCVRFRSIERARTSNDRDGVKLAAQQIKIVAELIDDPELGVPLDAATPFGRFLARMEAGDAGAQLRAAALRAAVAGADVDWQALQRSAGMTAAEMLAIGLGPIASDADRATPAFSGAEIDRTGLSATEVKPDV